MKWKLALCLALALALFLCACSHSNKSSGNGGKPFEQVGIASWYGKKFHGKQTASGEKFDMHKLTAAHRSLPFGTKVKVKNLDNGKKVVVRINDRGPFKKGRIIDLSYAAAKKIGMIKAGCARVKIRVVK